MNMMLISFLIFFALFTSFGAVVYWRHRLGLHAELTDLVPGMMAGFAIFAPSYLLEKYIKPETQKI